MNPKNITRRYLYSVRAFAAGGTLTQVDPDVAINLPIPTIAPTELPLAGGISEATAGQYFLRGRDANLDAVPAARRTALLDRTLFSVGSAHCLSQSDPETAAGPAGSQILSEVAGFAMDGGLSIEHLRLALRSTQETQNPYPSFSLIGTELSGLRLGDSNVTVTLDLDTLNRYAALNELDAALRENRDLRERLSSRFVIDPGTGGLYRNAAGEAAGSILESVSGLPPGATLDGYTINWPNFGKIVLGEVFMSPTVWRATLVQVIHSYVAAGGGSAGGCYYP